MKASMIKWFATLVAGWFAVLAAPASAQLSTTANGPYYATPSWDQKLTTNRFVILANWNNEAVLDRETGLVWERSPSISTDWIQASFQCMRLYAGGRSGWRLPTVQELLSLVDRSVSPGPMLPIGHPFANVESSVYWSGTVISGNVNAAWVVRFNDGLVDANSKSSLRLAWCVRGGQGPDAQ